MRFLTWYLVLAECLVFFTQAQERYDTCPGVEPMQDFQMSRFLGQWYVIWDTGMYHGKCITYNYFNAQEKEFGEYKLNITEFFPSADSSINQFMVFYDLAVSEPRTPGRMETEYIVRFSLLDDIWVKNVSHVVFMTDYDTYAGVFKYLPDIYGHRATILSRTKTLDLRDMDKIGQKLSQCGFELSNLKFIEQSGCRRHSSTSYINRKI